MADDDVDLRAAARTGGRLLVAAAAGLAVGYAADIHFRRAWVGFDILAADHWALAFQGLANRWYGASPVLPWSFTFTALGFAVAVPIAVTIAWKLSPLIMRLLSISLRPLLWVLKRGRGLPLKALRGLSGVARRRTGRIARTYPSEGLPEASFARQTATTAPEPATAKPGAETAAETTAPRSGDTESGPDPEQAPETAQAAPTPTAPPPPTTSQASRTSVLDFDVSVLDETASETPAATAAPVFTPADASDQLDAATVRAGTFRWLEANDWIPLLDQAVDADAGLQAFEGDGFDDDSVAEVPLLAISGYEITFIYPVDLMDKVWTVPLLDGIPVAEAAWTATDGTVMPCPLRTAMRARTRFQHMHAPILDAHGTTLLPGMAALPIFILLSNGEITNPEATGSWRTANITGCFADPVRLPDGTLTVSPESLALLFGENPDRHADPVLINAIAEGTAMTRRHMAAQQKAS